VKLDVHESMHHDTIIKVTNKMQLYRLIYFSLSPLHVSGNVFAHHQEYFTVFTVSGSIHPGGVFDEFQLIKDTSRQQPG
jgi:hypothetical protein